jgi:hypothetical protein
MSFKSLTLIVLPFALFASCGVLYTSEKTSEKLQNSVKSRVDSEKVNVSPEPGTYKGQQVVVLGLANPNDHTQLKIIEKQFYREIECPAGKKAHASDKCVTMESSARLEYIVIGNYTENGPLVGGKDKAKTAESEIRAADFIIE